MINLETITIREFRDLIKRRKSGESFDENVNIFIDAYISDTEKRTHPLEKITNQMQLFFKSLEHFTEIAMGIYTESSEQLLLDGWYMFGELPIKSDYKIIKESILNCIPMYEKMLSEKKLKIFKEIVHNYDLKYYYSATSTLWTIIDSHLFETQQIFRGGLCSKKQTFLSKIKMPIVCIRQLKHVIENKSILLRKGNPTEQVSNNRHKLLHGNSVEEDIIEEDFLKVLSLFFFIIDCRNKYKSGENDNL